MTEKEDRRPVVGSAPRVGRPVAARKTGRLLGTVDAMTSTKVYVDGHPFKYGDVYPC